MYRSKACFINKNIINGAHCAPLRIIKKDGKDRLESQILLNCNLLQLENHKKYCKNTKNNVIYYKSNSKGLYYELFRFNEILV